MFQKLTVKSNKLTFKFKYRYLVKLSLFSLILSSVLFTSLGCKEKKAASGSNNKAASTALEHKYESQNISSLDLDNQNAEDTKASSETVITKKNSLDTSNASDSEKEDISTAENITPKQEKPALKIIKGLVPVLAIDDTIVVDLKYATSDNFTGQVIYSFRTCLLREETARKLAKANAALKQQGYRIKIFDGYRPPFAQQILWNAFPKEGYVANPNKGGSIHSKGGAVDITIIDSNGNEVEMPSKYDDLTIKGGRKSPNMTNEAKKNMDLLTNAMIEAGFRSISTEWWHYDDIDYKKYKIIDVDPKLFE